MVGRAWLHQDKDVSLSPSMATACQGGLGHVPEPACTPFSSSVKWAHHPYSQGCDETPRQGNLYSVLLARSIESLLSCLLVIRPHCPRADGLQDMTAARTGGDGKVAAHLAWSWGGQLSYQPWIPVPSLSVPPTQASTFTTCRELPAHTAVRLRRRPDTQHSPVTHTRSGSAPTGPRNPQLPPHPRTRTPTHPTPPQRPLRGAPSCTGPLTTTLAVPLTRCVALGQLWSPLNPSFLTWKTGTKHSSWEEAG